MSKSHIPVLLNECIDNLNISREGVYIDCTLGGAGHSIEIYKRLSLNGHLIGIDQDIKAIEYSKKRFQNINENGQLNIINDNFTNLKDILKDLGISSVNGILADLGVSSFQLDTVERGFSYQNNSDLDMRMDNKSVLSAGYVVNNYDEGKLVKIIKEYGEERWAKRIVNFIIREREKKVIKTTFDLVDIIKKAIPASARREGPHPAKRTFQAIRIEVNNELNILREVINDMADLLTKEGRVCIITFHSLEDKIVKSEFNKLINSCICPRDFPICVCNKKQIIKNITRKPIVPKKEEIENNPRSRSAKLRVYEKL
ncbi:MAG: 16S rRNA (cytosine(1402)-N(4))-methyltransferase RsmH [Clostridiales bacterium]